jgi:2',3'-cyclic-nucleotide 2'-phosphodiesterase (5'-nucleotidase family)
VHGRAAPALEAAPTLRIIGTNDFHGGLEARPNGTAGRWGGAAALGGAIRRARAECAAPRCYSVLVDAGDEFQGQASSTLARGWPVSEIFNYLGYDAAALGNHDLDWGQDTLRLRMAQEHYSVLSANLRTIDGRPAAWIAPDTILRRGPFTIGLIGMMTREAATAIAASNLAGLQFIDPVPIVDSLTRELRRRGATVVVVLAHAGAQCAATPPGACTGEIIDDARRLREPVDAIIAGHRHLLVNTVVNGVPVTSARMSGQAIDVVDLVRGERPHAEVRDIFVDSVAPDTAVARMVKAAVDAAGPRLAERVATIADDMPQPDAGEFALGDLVADAYRAAGAADLGVTNHAGVRAPLHAGIATYATVFDVLPFGNRLVRITASGAAVRRYFEKLVAGRIPGAFISGATATVDATKPAGSRVLSVTLDSGRRLDDASMYTMVINDFMQTGGDGLAFPDSTARAEMLVPSDLEAMITYLHGLPSPVRAPSPNRWDIRR